MPTPFPYQPLFETVELGEQYPNGKRHYVTPDGVFPSVTTVISRQKDNSWLEKWKARVGEAEAERVSRLARMRGTSFHKLAERYLLNEEDYAAGINPLDVADFRPVAQILNTHVQAVHGLEVPLWSKFLRTAGRTDGLVTWDGGRTVLDFKTSKRRRKAEEITDYFVQASVYGIMANERIEDPKNCFKTVAIVMMVDHEDPQVFVQPIAEYADMVLKWFRS